MADDAGLDPTLLRSFLEIAESRSFTLAANRLSLRQSTLSQHIRKLEEQVGRRLFQRDTHSVSLTVDGEAMIGFARSIMESQTKALHFFSGVRSRDRVRLGVSEDFTMALLSNALRNFVAEYPDVDLELHVGLSRFLYEKLDARELDLLFSKRLGNDDRGTLVWSEELAWIGSPDVRLDDDEPVPLVVFPLPSITRALAIRALEENDRRWRIACTSGSLSGIWAATLAAAGVSAQSGKLLPPGLVQLPASLGLPRLSSVDFVLVGANATLRGPAAALAQCIIALGNAPAIKPAGHTC